MLSVAKMSERRCFQVLGVDILLDGKARPFLLEINDHPSLRIDLSFDEPGQYSMNGLNSIPSPVDEAIKVPMLASAMRLVGKEHSLRLGRRRRAKAKKGTRTKAAAHVDAGGDEAADAANANGLEGREAAEAAEAMEAEAAEAEAEAEAEAAAEAEADDDDALEDAEEEADVVAPASEGLPAGPEPLVAPSAARPHPTDGVHGTAFFPVPTEAEDGFELLTRLARLFEKHTPASVRREAADPTRAKLTPPQDALTVPGPRWKGPAPFGAFLQSAGILASRGATARSAKGGGTLARPDLDLIFLAVCGKGGSMDVMDFAEACIRVAQRLWPERADAHSSELLEALLDTYFADDDVEG